MYKIIASQFPANFPYYDFSKMARIFDRSDIESYLSNITHAVHYDFISQPSYPGETFFLGFGNQSIWISLNILENSNKLFLHTTKIPKKNSKLKDVSSNYTNIGFMPNTNLFEVGLLSDTEQNLINAVNNILTQL